jgi:4-nitrophenyl phosphatase
MKVYRAYLFDLDGTLYRGDEPVPHAADVLGELRKQGALIRFLTNNSSRTRSFFGEKLRRLGFQCDDDEVYSSATGSAKHLMDKGLRSAYVLGMEGLSRTLVESGIEVVNRASDLSPMPMQDGPIAAAAVVGICTNLTYDLLSGTMRQVRAGAEFVATNPDTTFPLEGGRLTPGAGAMVAAVQACTGATPFIVGKPNPFLVQMAIDDACVGLLDTLVVGDRMDTDVECGRRAGCPTHLVLTGVESSAPPGQSFSPDLRGLLC